MAVVSTPMTVRGRGYNSMRRRFRELFGESYNHNGCGSLVNVVRDIAFDAENPKQMDAIKFAMAYGFGQPEKLDEQQVVLMAETHLAKLLEAEERKLNAITVAQETPDGVKAPK